jgi:hypothetical protein
MTATLPPSTGPDVADVLTDRRTAAAFRSLSGTHGDVAA